jgi:hypothetical protein
LQVSLFWLYPAVQHAGSPHLNREASDISPVLPPRSSSACAMFLID